MLYKCFVPIPPSRSIHLSLYRTSFSLVLEIDADTRASAVDKTGVRLLQPRRSPRKHSSNRELKNKTAFGSSASSSFGAIFDDRVFVHSSAAKDLESTPPERESQVADDGADDNKTYEDVLARTLGGSATSAAGGAASPGQESSDSCDKFYYDTFKRTAKELKR